MECSALAVSRLSELLSCASAAVAANPFTGEVVMFGGLADVNPTNTWTYDGTTWSLQSPLIQPPLVYAGSAAFDPEGMPWFCLAAEAVA
jgi:hypothetical protein